MTSQTSRNAKAVEVAADNHGAEPVIFRLVEFNWMCTLWTQSPF